MCGSAYAHTLISFYIKVAFLRVFSFGGTATRLGSSAIGNRRSVSHSDFQLNFWYFLSLSILSDSVLDLFDNCVTLMFPWLCINPNHSDIQLYLLGLGFFESLLTYKYDQRTGRLITVPAPLCCCQLLTGICSVT